MRALQAVRGMKDILPGDTYQWQTLETILRSCLSRYAYQEIRMPIVEPTELFKRTIGEVTDIVEKEMYTFSDRNGDSLSLRPEGTAQCVRAGIEHGLFYNKTPRLWYTGPMFRHERPQKGRYRQFYQLGVECFGLEGPDIDVEQLLLCKRMFQELGIFDNLTLEINTLGTSDSRANYRKVLVEYLNDNQDALDEDSRRRLTQNPMRILDSKNPDMISLISNAPKLLDHLDDVSQAHFAQLRQRLDNAKVEYTINKTLVRGLDYYNHTVYEWKTDQLGAQGTICAGGRYDGLVEQIGGKPCPSSGFAMGLERILSLMEPKEIPGPDVFMIVSGDNAYLQAMTVAENLRDRMPGVQLQVNCGQQSLKSQFKKADKSGAQFALILGDDELSNNQLGLKNLRKHDEQQTLSIDETIEFILKHKGV